MGFSVIPAKAGIQLFQVVLDPGACPGPDPGFAEVTIQETFYETIVFVSARILPRGFPRSGLSGA
jgi:hypothetical protein